MADAIFKGNLIHDTLGDPETRAIANQLKKHPLLE
jgi:hypothetical protein